MLIIGVKKRIHCLQDVKIWVQYEVKRGTLEHVVWGEIHVLMLWEVMEWVAWVSQMFTARIACLNTVIPHHQIHLVWTWFATGLLTGYDVKTCLHCFTLPQNQERSINSKQDATSFPAINAKHLSGFLTLKDTKTFESMGLGSAFRLNRMTRCWKYV